VIENPSNRLRQVARDINCKIYDVALKLKQQAYPIIIVKYFFIQCGAIQPTWIGIAS